jgi:hypothetical protein
LVELVTPVLKFVTVTSASGITAFEGSVTVPTMLPVVACPRLGRLLERHRMASKRRSVSEMEPMGEVLGCSRLETNDLAAAVFIRPLVKGIMNQPSLVSTFRQRRMDALQLR